MKLEDLGLNKDLLTVSISVGLLVLGFNIATSLIVVYLMQIGLSSLFVGIVIGVSRLAFSILTLPSGTIVRKYGFKLPTVWSFLLCSVSFLILSISSDPIISSIFIILLWSGTAIYGPPVSSYISKVSIERKTALAFGWYYAIITLAQVAGQSLSGIIAQNFGYNVLFILGLIFSLLASFLVSFLIKEEGKNTRNSFTLFTLDDFKEGIAFFIKNKSIRNLSIAMTFHTIGFMASFTFIPLVAKVDQKFDDATVGIILAIWSIGNAVFQIPFGRITDKIGGKKILISHVLASSLVWWIYPFTNSIYAILILMILQGIVGAMDLPARRLIMKDISEEEFAVAIGVLDSFTTLLGSIGPLAAGILWNYEHWLPFVFGSLINLVSLFLLLRI